ncbi:MAG: hypothetical protein K6U14_10815 [Firmicutes bacterium]|nr:hypothetical protein [Alicyclobacillaceae bacterium]MCL6498103.1 hypothetical protein [Bacillota bacterium]
MPREEAAGRLERTARGEWPWTAAWGAGDLAALYAFGWEPVGQVSGACAIHAAVEGDGDVESVARAWARAYYTARDTAMKRAQAQAETLGGTLVLGARPEWRRDGAVVECRLHGTAFRGPETGTVVVSPLSAQEAARLRAVGIRPVGTAFGYARQTWPVGYRAESSAAPPGGALAEWEGLTRRLAQVRRAALERLREDAQRIVGARGVVGAVTRQTVEDTELRFVGYPGQGLVLDGVYYAYEANGVVNVPAFTFEVFMVGAAVTGWASGMNAIGTGIRL